MTASSLTVYQTLLTSPLAHTQVHTCVWVYHHAAAAAAAAAVAAATICVLVT